MPIVTLTSDIGYQDYVIPSVKAQLLRINQDFNIIDISHDISPFNIPQAAYICRNSIKNFPDFSFHILLINLFAKKPSQLLLAFNHNQYLICPDNGILTMIFESKPELLLGIPLEKDEQKNTLTICKKMGETIQHIVSGKPMQNFGIHDPKFIEKIALKPQLGSDWIDGQILYIDSFENVIINITKDDFEEQRNGRNFSIVFQRDEMITQISESYADVPEGEKLALFNSAGYLEIAINQGNAAGLFGLVGFSQYSKPQIKYIQNNISYKTVKIHFK